MVIASFVCLYKQVSVHLCQFNLSVVFCGGFFVFFSLFFKSTCVSLTLPYVPPVFSVYMAVLFFSIGRVKVFQNNVHHSKRKVIFLKRKYRLLSLYYKVLQATGN